VNEAVRAEFFRVFNRILFTISIEHYCQLYSLCLAFIRKSNDSLAIDILARYKFILHTKCYIEKTLQSMPISISIFGLQDMGSQAENQKQ